MFMRLFKAFQGRAKNEINHTGEIPQDKMTCFHCRFITDYLRQPCLKLELLDQDQESMLLHSLAESKRNHANKLIVRLGEAVTGRAIKFSVKCPLSKPAFVHITADRQYILCRHGTCKSFIQTAAKHEESQACGHLRVMHKCFDSWKDLIVVSSCDERTRRYTCRFNTTSHFWEVPECYSKHIPTQSADDHRLIK